MTRARRRYYCAKVHCALFPTSGQHLYASQVQHVVEWTRAVVQARPLAAAGRPAAVPQAYQTKPGEAVLRVLAQVVFLPLVEDCKQAQVPIVFLPQPVECKQARARVQAA